MNRNHPWKALHLTLAGGLAFGGLMGCAAPAVAPAPVASAAAPATAAPPATAANTTAEQGAAALATEAELEDYALMLAEAAATPAAYALTQSESAVAAKASQSTRRPVSDEVRTQLRARIQAKGQAAFNEARNQAKVTHGQMPSPEQAWEAAMARVREAQKKAREFPNDVHAKEQALILQHMQSLRPRWEHKTATHHMVRQQAQSAAFVDHGDGTMSRTLSFNESRRTHRHTAVHQVAHTGAAKWQLLQSSSTDDSQSDDGQSDDSENVAHVVRIVHTVTKEGQHHLATSVHLERTWRNGRKSVAHWVKTVRPEGGHHVAFHEVVTHPSKVSHSTHWEKQVTAQGAVSGSGTMALMKPTGLLSRAWGIKHTAVGAATVSDLVAGAIAKVAIGPKGDMSATAQSDDSAAEASVPVDSDSDDSDATAADDVGSTMDDTVANFGN